MDRKHLIDVAMGRKPADVVFTNGRIVNVFTREIVGGEIAVAGGVIAAIGDSGTYRGNKTVDLEGKTVIPGLIDSHVHIESSLLSPEQFARLVVPRGTTTVVADPHEIANVAGIDGIRYMIDAAKDVPLDVFFHAPLM